MKTTTTMKTALGSFAVCLALGAAAADISGVTVRQRWPWSRLVDIDYVLCDTTQAVDVAVTAYNGSTPLTLPDGSLSGDRHNVSADGTHRIVWDPTVTAYTNLEVLSKFKVALTPTPSPLYMVVDLSGGTSATSYPVSNYLAEADVPGGVTNDLYKTTSLLLRRISDTAGQSFNMGSPTTEKLRTSREDQHPVRLTRSFYIGVYEVTQKQWERIAGNWPSYFTNMLCRDMRPVEQVSYAVIRGTVNGTNWPASTSVDDASFMGRLRAKTALSTLDLPTDAQLEFACRAGTTGALNNGKVNLAGPGDWDPDPDLDSLGRYLNNSGRSYSGDGSITNIATWTVPSRNCLANEGTAPVGSYFPNAWGLYDTHGNVWELCLDWQTDRLGSEAQIDPKGPSTGVNRVFRGGSWYYQASRSRSACRSLMPPSNASNDLGFRVALHLQ